MKKFTFVVALLLGMNGLFAQANSQLNFGLIGVSYDIPLAENFSIAPFARTGFEVDWMSAGIKADYYFDNLIGLPAEWDLYGGANAGFVVWHDEGKDIDNLDIGLEVGARYFWNETWGILLEASGGVNYGGMLGLTMRL
jgi:hypothetical protein